jgi:hypothetical protein
VIVVTAARKQKLGPTIGVAVTCKAEACTVSASGQLRVGARTFRLAAVTKDAAADTATTLTLRLPAAARQAAKRALAAHRTAKVTVSVAARDAAGNTARATRTVQLVR